MSWLRAAHPQRFTSIMELVQFVCDFLEVLWAEGGAKSLAGDVLSSLQWHLPQLKPRLKEGLDLFAVWTRAEEVTRAVPFSRQMLLAFVVRLIETDRPAAACALWLCFEGLLRIGEALTLLVADVEIQLERRKGVLTLRQTKTTRRAGGTESVILEDHRLLLFLLAVMRGKPLGMPILGLSYHHVHSAILDCCAHFNLSHLYLRSHSCRRGGATDFYLSTGSLSATMLRGRWANQKTARLYVNAALAESVVQSLSAHVTRVLSAAATRLSAALATWGCMELGGL
eukprot:6469517-Amphidinium_carterae.3